MKRINWLGRGQLGEAGAAARESFRFGCAPRTTRLLKLGIFGTIITALCCFTPILVVLFGVLGLGGLVGETINIFATATRNEITTLDLETGVYVHPAATSDIAYML